MARKKKKEVVRAYHTFNNRNALIDLFLIIIGHVVLWPLFDIGSYWNKGDASLEPTSSAL